MAEFNKKKFNSRSTRRIQAQAGMSGGADRETLDGLENTELRGRKAGSLDRGQRIESGD